MKNSTYKLAQMRASNNVQKVHPVFLVESSKITRASLRCSINSYDLTKVVAECAYEDNLYENIKNSGANIVIFSSFSLKNNRLETIEELKRNLPTLRVIILTQEPDEEEFYQTVIAGFEGYCQNNADSYQIAEAINTVACGNNYIPQGMNKFIHRLIQHMGKINPHPIDKPIEEQANLTKREHEIMELVCASMTNAEIADKLCISPNTVKAHIGKVFRKFSVSCRVEAVLKYNETYCGFNF